MVNLKQILVLLAALTLSGVSSASLIDDLKREEGFLPYVKEISPTEISIGYGLNLLRKDSYRLLRNSGLTPNQVHMVLRGDFILSKDKATKVLELLIVKAREDASIVFPTFKRLPLHVQGVLTHMSFQLGQTRLTQFRLLKRCVRKEDWNCAASEMRDSLWYKQTPARVERLIQKLLS